jgi:hypothetical protein
VATLHHHSTAKIVNLLQNKKAHTISAGSQLLVG